MTGPEFLFDPPPGMRVRQPGPHRMALVLIAVVFCLPDPRPRARAVDGRLAAAAAHACHRHDPGDADHLREHAAPGAADRALCLLLCQNPPKGNGLSAAIDVHTPKEALMIAADPGTSPTTRWLVGFWWAELIQPHWTFTEAGCAVEIVSPKGGNLVADGFSDPEDASG